MAYEPLFVDGEPVFIERCGSTAPAFVDDACAEEDQCCEESTCDEFPLCLSSLDYETFTSSGTAEWPDDVTSAQVEAWGRGGVGGPSDAPTEAGGGGGGGAYARTIDVQKNVADLTVTVNDAANGHDSEVENEFGTVCLAKAGSAGANGPGGAGGAGGLAASCVGDVAFSGGDGAAGSDSNYGGGGGGGAGSCEAGGNASGQTGGTGGEDFGGDGGDGADSTTDPEVGENYGGGGGGALNDDEGGDRGNGRVRIGWRMPTELLVNISGAPSGTSDCDCDEEIGFSISQTTSWNAISGGGFVLKNVGGGNVFDWFAEMPGGGPVDCDVDDSVRNSSAVLMGTFLHQDCSPDPGGDIEQEYYLTAMRVTLACDAENGMFISGFSLFGCCVCERHRNAGEDWQAWECASGGGTPPCAFDCGLGAITNYAAPCGSGNMSRELTWPLLTVNPCHVGSHTFNCGLATTGSISAQLT